MMHRVLLACCLSSLLVLMVNSQDLETKEKECPKEKQVQCLTDPCATATCPNHPTAVCSQRCGSCKAKWKVDGKHVRCSNTPCPMVNCARQCDNGYIKNRKGCQTCMCNTPCPEVKCSIQCDKGYIKNRKGCQTCKCRCRDPKTPCPRIERGSDEATNARVCASNGRSYPSKCHFDIVKCRFDNQVRKNAGKELTIVSEGAACIKTGGKGKGGKGGKGKGGKRGGKRGGKGGPKRHKKHGHKKRGGRKDIKNKE